MYTILGVLQAFLTVPALVAVTESLPKAVRSGSLAIMYAVAISLCGGTTQFAIKALTEIDPADSPATVTRAGSPPNAAMFSCTHWQIACTRS